MATVADRLLRDVGAVLDLATDPHRAVAMSRGLGILGVASALVGALLLATLLRGPEPARKESNDPTPSAIPLPRELEGDLPSGRSAPSVHRTEAPLVEASPPPLADDRVASAAALPISLPEIAEDVQVASPQVAGQITEAEREMASQDKDPLRSPAMETRILSEIAQKALGLEITYLQADCRITLCRLQFALPKSLLEKKFGNVPQDTVWTGREPVGFFIKALNLEWRYTTAFGGLDRYGVPVVLGYVAMPLPSAEP